MSAGASASGIHDIFCVPGRISAFLYAEWRFSIKAAQRRSRGGVLFSHSERVPAFSASLSGG